MISALKITADSTALVGEPRCITFKVFSTGYVVANAAGMMAKYFATSFASEKVVSAPRVISICFPVSTTSISLVGIAVEVDQVAGLARRLRARLHRERDVGLRQRRRVVGAVAGHRDQAPALLVLTDQRQLRFRRRFGQEVIDAGLGGDGGRGERVVAGDHHGPDPHAAQLVEALPHAALHDVLQAHDAENARALGDDERRAAGPRDLLDRREHGRRHRPAALVAHAG